MSQCTHCGFELDSGPDRLCERCERSKPPRTTEAEKLRALLAICVNRLAPMYMGDANSDERLCRTCGRQAIGAITHSPECFYCLIVGKADLGPLPHGDSVERDRD